MLGYCYAKAQPLSSSASQGEADYSVALFTSTCWPCSTSLGPHSLSDHEGVMQPLEIKTQKWGRSIGGGRDRTERDEGKKERKREGQIAHVPSVQTQCCRNHKCLTAQFQCLFLCRGGPGVTPESEKWPNNGLQSGFEDTVSFAFSLYMPSLKVLFSSEHDVFFCTSFPTVTICEKDYRWNVELENIYKPCCGFCRLGKCLV